MTYKKAFLMITEKLEFGAGLPTEILGVCYPEAGDRGIVEPCFHIRVAGRDRFVPVEPSTHYLFLSETDVSTGKIPEVFGLMEKMGC